MALVRQANITAWHSATGSSADDIAREAYEDAVKYFEEELTRDDRKRDWIRGQNSLNDVLEAVSKAQAIYTAKHPASKARTYVVALASRIHYYGGVLDALAQHHPEYVALAWGAMKFVFNGVLNHAELVVELARALGDIADVLPHITLGMDLYPTVYMKEAVSRVYAHIMLFLNKAAKWYSMSPARRALSAISKPYSIGYKDTVHQIRLCADSVNLVAGAAGRAELRDLTIIIQEQTARLQARDYDLDLMKSTLQRLCGSADASEKKLFQILHFAQSSQSISGATLLEVKDHGVRLRDIQFSTILETLKPERSPADVLIACNFLAQRRQLWKQPTHESVKFIQTFNQWVNGPASSLFVLQAGLRAEARAKDLAVQAITLLKDSLHTVFWYLSERRPTQNDLNITDVLQTLVFQVLARHPDIFESHPEIVNVTAFKSDHTEQEWLTLLSVVLSHLPKCFLVVEMEGLHNITAQSELGRQLLQAFKQLVDNLRDNDNLLKVLLVHYGVPSMAGASTGVGLGNYSTYVRAPLMGAAGVNMGRAAKLRRKGKVGGRH